MKPTSNNLRQTMRAQVDELVVRLPTIQAMADGRPDTPDPDRRRRLPPVGDLEAEADVELAAPYSDPVAAAVVAQADARAVLAAYAIFRNALAAASAGARRLVPKVIPLCAGCGEPVGARKTETFHGATYHKSPCEMRARRLAKAEAEAKAG
jgi:hypothetical protein